MKQGEQAVRYMRKMATGCRWRVWQEITYTGTDGSVFLLTPGVWYTGIPYTQGKKRRRYNLFRFRLNLFLGIFFLKKSLVGCDCSSAASFAWKKENSSFPILSTRKMLKDLCGKQKFISHRQRYRVEGVPIDTKKILSFNKMEVLLEAYKALNVGDGLLQYDSEENRGHVMVVSAPLCGNYIGIIDQKGFGKGGSEKEDTSWRIDHAFTVGDLIEEGYLPIYINV